MLALADQLLGFPFDRLIRCTRAPEGWVLVDREARVVFVQLTRVVTLGPERLGVMGWTLAAPRGERPAPGRAIQVFFDEVHAALRRAGCQRLVVGDSDAYRSPSWRLAHAGGYRRWTPAQQLRRFGWRWPALFWRLPHFGVRTFVLQRPLDTEVAPSAPASRGLGAACCVTLFVGAVLFPLAASGGLWGGISLSAWRAPALLLGVGAAAVHMSSRALAQGLVARRHGLALEFRVWDSGLVAATMCALAGVFFPALGGAPYARDERYDYSNDRDAFGSARAAGVFTSLLLSALALVSLRAQLGAPEFASAVLLYGLWSGLSDTLPLGGPWSALAVGAVRRRHPLLAAMFFVAWCALLVFGSSLALLG
ncbi:MAG: hypothetical protein DHS20C15_12210 [Planctomycetota bacterium]|nr:MAG: hypothetical protein DHS20C15_12210 [Planctomycetota bacterium]